MTSLNVWRSSSRLISSFQRGGKGRKKWGGGEFIPILAFGEEPRPELPTSAPNGWTNKSRRTGLLFKKLEMVTIFDQWSTARAVTALKLADNMQVTQVKLDETDGYTSLQVGAGVRKLKQLNKPQIGHFAAANVTLKQMLREFRVTRDAVLPVGTPLQIHHFVVGQHVDITGLSKGKGFAGVMKRHGFSGGNASHGASLSHRAAGSTGSAQDPGRVWKGKKMAGHMGNSRVTVRNLRIYQILEEENVLLVVGAVPGPKLGWLEVQDAKHKPFLRAPPFPTYMSRADLDSQAANAAPFKQPRRTTQSESAQ